jgi:RNA polymerase sigma factor (sigma-70 family)
MSFHWVFNKCSNAVKSELEEYWSKKWPRLAKLLEPSYSPELQEVRLTVTCHEQSPQRLWYDIHAAILLPTGSLAAKSHDKDPRAALDDVTDLLAAEIERHKERVRKDYIFKRKTRPHTDISAAGPQAKRRPTIDDREAFTRQIRPLLADLREHIRHELRALEIEEVLHRNELSVADLMDEVLARAWQNFADRPRNQSLKNWLIEILHDTLEELVKQEPRRHESMEEDVDETRPSEVPQVDDQEWWAWLLGDEERLNLGDYVSRLKDAEIWNQIEAEEDQQQIGRLVNDLLPPLQRQAFVLNVLEDFAPFEIAMVQNRPESEVKADIEKAKQRLREWLGAERQEREFSHAGHSDSAAGKS